MNISSLQPLNSKFLNTKYLRITSAALSVFILLASTIALVTLRGVSGDENILASGEIDTSFFDCNPIAFSDCIAKNDVDLDDPPDGIIDRRYVIRNGFDIWSGDIVGTALNLQMLESFQVPVGPPTSATIRETRVFTGTVAGSGPGSFSINDIGIVDIPAFPPSPPFEGTMTVVPGSGVGGLAGICGGGTWGRTLGGPITYNLVFRFGDDCDGFTFNDILDILAENDDDDSS